VPWNSSYFPASMKHLPPRVREKAIEIANALLAEGIEEGKAIRIAIAKAKEWGRREPAARGPVRSTGIARGESTPEADARVLRSRRRGKEAEREPAARSLSASPQRGASGVEGGGRAAGGER